jgi:hypothetical protein
LLLIDGRPAFRLWLCWTCPFLFQRLEGSNSTLSLDELQDRLTEGLTGLDDEVIAKFAQLLPKGTYRPLLLRVEPRLIEPGAPGDYFSEEVVATWSDDPPDNPRTPYYRTFETAIGPDDHLYEFIVPMVPPRRNDPDRVREWAQLLARSSRPTAVAVSILDAHSGDGSAFCDPEAPSNYMHWCLTHFLLDGHHKLEAAALEQRPIQLLTLLSFGPSWQSQWFDQLSDVLRQEPRRREVA